MWSIQANDEDIFIPNFIFNKIQFGSILIDLLRPTKILNKTFYLHGNNYQKAISFSLFGNLANSFNEFFNFLCFPLKNIKRMGFVLFGSSILNKTFIIKKETFKKCSKRNLQLLTIQFSEEGPKIILEPYFLDYLGSLHSFSLLESFIVLKNNSFSLSKFTENYRYVDFATRDNATMIIEDDAFVKINLGKSYLNVKKHFLEDYSIPLIKYLNDSKNNVITFQEVIEVYCGCDFYWIYQKQDQFNFLVDDEIYRPVLCEDGRIFFNLTKKDFKHCKLFLHF